MQNYDSAWKALCDPATQFGRDIIKRLIGHDLEKFNPYSENTESTVNGKKQQADLYIVFTVDTEQKRYNIEFQSTTDTTIGIRLLQYAMPRLIGPKIKRQGRGIGVEGWIMPKGYIVDVSQNAHNGVDGERKLLLTDGAQHVVFTYPVVHVRDCLPEVYAVTQSVTEEDLFRTSDKFYNSIVTTDTNLENQKFHEAFVRLCMTSEFSRKLGLDFDGMEARIMEHRETLAQRYRRDGFEKGKASGRKEGEISGAESLIRDIMQNLNCSREDVLRMAGRDISADDGGSSATRLKL